MRPLLNIVRAWYSFAAVTLAALGSLYYGIPKMLQTCDWYCEKYDAKVLQVIKTRREITDAIYSPPIYRTLPQTVDTVSAELRRSPKSVEKSLRRLKRRGKAEFVGNGWEGR